MSKRLSFQSSIDCSDIFTEEFQNLLVKLHEKFNTNFNRKQINYNEIIQIISIAKNELIIKKIDLFY